MFSDPVSGQAWDAQALDSCPGRYANAGWTEEDISGEIVYEPTASPTPFIRALRLILKNEEIIVDYGRQYWSESNLQLLSQKERDRCCLYYRQPVMKEMTSMQSNSCDEREGNRRDMEISLADEVPNPGIPERCVGCSYWAMGEDMEEETMIITKEIGSAERMAQPIENHLHPVLRGVSGYSTNGRIKITIGSGRQRLATQLWKQLGSIGSLEDRIWTWIWKQTDVKLRVECKVLELSAYDQVNRPDGSCGFQALGWHEHCRSANDVAGEWELQNNLPYYSYERDAATLTAFLQLKRNALSHSNHDDQVLCNKIDQVIQFWSLPNKRGTGLPQNVYASPEELVRLGTECWGVLVQDADSRGGEWATVFVHT